jgi:hypothetical protein
MLPSPAGSGLQLAGLTEVGGPDDTWSDKPVFGGVIRSG